MKNQPVVINATCGNCAAWREVEPTGPVTIGAKRRGICYGVPATPFPQFTGSRVTGQLDLRPCPGEDESCLLFTPRGDLIPSQTPQ